MSPYHDILLYILATLYSVLIKIRKNQIHLGSTPCIVFSENNHGFSFFGTQTVRSRTTGQITHLIFWNEKSFLFWSTSTVSKLIQTLIKIHYGISLTVSLLWYVSESIFTILNWSTVIYYSLASRHNDFYFPVTSIHHQYNSV